MPIVSEEYKEEKKEQILDSAFECFAKKGFQTATMDDIVAHCGMSKGAIYNYFSSKEEIYLDLLTRATDKNFVQYHKHFAKHRTASSKIDYLFNAYLSANPIDRKRLEYIVVFYEFNLHSTRDPDLLQQLHERKRKLVTLVNDIIQEGQQQGEFKQDIPSQLYAERFWTIIDGVNLHAVYDEFPYYDVLRELKDMYLDELKSE